MKPITGSIVALVTPMHDDGSIDYDALRRLIDWHIAEGTQCIGVVGTTGESPTVTVEEHCEVIRVAVEHARGRVPVMAGTGANSTAEAIELSRFALKVGADCTLSVVPYYNKPSQEGIYRHFRAIAEAVDIPMVLYNVPGRTVADMPAETALRLAQVPGIDRHQGSDRRHRPRRALIARRAGGLLGLFRRRRHGRRADAARRPRQRQRHRQRRAARDAGALRRGARRRRARAAARLQLQLLPLHQALFVEPSPAPTKWALARSAAAARPCACRSCRSANGPGGGQRPRCAKPGSCEPPSSETRQPTAPRDLSPPRS